MAASPASSSSSIGVLGGSLANGLPFDPVVECQKLIDLRNRVASGVYPKFSLPTKPEEAAQKEEYDGYKPVPYGYPQNNSPHGDSELKRKREWETNIPVDDARLKRRDPSQVGSPELRNRDSLSYSSELTRHPPYSPGAPMQLSAQTNASYQQLSSSQRYNDEYGRSVHSVDSRQNQYSSNYGNRMTFSYYDQNPTRVSSSNSMPMSSNIMPPGVIVEDGYTRDTQRGYELYIPSASRKHNYRSSNSYSYNSYPVRQPSNTAQQPLISHWPPYAPPATAGSSSSSSHPSDQRSGHSSWDRDHRASPPPHIGTPIWERDRERERERESRQHYYDDRAVYYDQRPPP
ncbi:hypothetical protein V1511DRAFT_458436 [Dipodascopsis uninucleata]